MSEYCPECGTAQHVCIHCGACAGSCRLKYDVIDSSGKKLKELGASDVRLYITHCEDNIKNGEILKTDVISKVYTTDSICHIEDEKIEFVRIFRG